MKAEELMIEDLVPITDTILRKVGYVADDKGYYHIEGNVYLRGNCLGVKFCSEETNRMNFITFCEVNYINDLQHALKLLHSNKKLSLR